MILKNSTIKIKLLVIISVVIVISFIVLGLNNSKNEFESEYKSVKNEEILVTKNTARYIDNYLQSKIAIVESISQTLPDSFGLKDEVVLRMLKSGKLAGDFMEFYFSFQSNGNLLGSNGNLLTMEKDKYDARTRGWYKEAVSSNKTGITAPYVDFQTKKLVITIFTPFVRNSEVIGVVLADIVIEDIVKKVLNTQLNKTGFSYLVNKDNKILIHKDNKILNKESVLLKGVRTKENNGFDEFSENNKDYLVAYNFVPTTNWYLVTQLEKQEIYDVISKNIWSVLIIYFILLFIILAILFFTLKKLLSPLTKVQDGLNFFFKYLRGEEKQVKTLDIKTNDEFGKMALVIDEEMLSIEKNLNDDKVLIEEVKDVVNFINNGDLNVQVKKSTSNKTLNELKDILNEMIKTVKLNVNSNINPILEVLEEYSKLDFTQLINNPDGKVSKGLNNLNNLVNQMIKENKLNGITLNENAKSLLDNVDTLNRSSNETAVSLEETAAAVEEITSTIANNTNRIAQMSQHSQELITSINQGQNLANSTVTSMDEINEQTQAIAEAITVIDQIAFQTNILSLNAAVEAATAGEAGKGFAVVAQEVRNLASRSAEAAKEIKDLVENATLKTDSGKQIADQMIHGYNKLNEDIAKTTEAINDISKASREQQISIEQINDVINRLDRETQQNASVATQTKDIANDTSKIAQEILDAVNNKKFRE